MDVNELRPAAAHGVGHLARRKPAPEQPECGTPAREPGGLAREDLGALPQALAHQPGEIVDDPLLPACGPVAVVDEQDHG